MAPSKENKPSPTTSPPSTASSGKHSINSRLSEINLDSNNNSGSTKSSPRQPPKQAFSSQSDIGSVSRLNVKHGSSPAMSGYSTARSGYGRSTTQSQTGSQGQFWARFKPELELNFVKQLDERHECAMCQQVLRYPVLMECGHHCCNACMSDLLRVEPRCPIDQSRVDKSQLRNDRQLQKEIETLFVRCSNYMSGCSWSGYLKELMSHMDRCEYTMINCPNDCGADFERRFLQVHQTDDCSRRSVPCRFCSKGIAMDEMQNHYDSCKKFLVSCPNNCGLESLPRDKLTNHLDLECPEQPVQCPFYESGCIFKSKRSELRAHISQAPEIHLEMMVTALTSCADALEIHDSILERQSDRLNSVESQVSVLDKMNGYQLVWKIDDYKARFEKAVSGEVKALESPVFSAFRHGYRMMLSVCLNGDGKAEGKYMSVYACLVKGDYDALLPWPYNMELTISLLDQNKDPSARKEYHQKLRPHACKENMVFLKRPLGDKNPCFGLVRFIELEKLQRSNFVMNNLMFLKVKLEHDTLKNL